MAQKKNHDKPLPLKGKVEVGRRPGAGPMGDRRLKRQKTRAARKRRALREGE